MFDYVTRFKVASTSRLLVFYPKLIPLEFSVACNQMSSDLIYTKPLAHSRSSVNEGPFLPSWNAGLAKGNQGMYILRRDCGEEKAGFVIKKINREQHIFNSSLNP